MKPNTLIVSEVFYSIQGEGPTMGVPAVFLRLAGCNLLCESKTWRCDTIEVWQKGKATPFDEVFDETHLAAFKHNAHLVITGGEPLLHQHAIVDFLTRIFSSPSFAPVIEIETNGTIIPSEGIKRWVSKFNVSPKLANSGEIYERRVNEVALRHFANMRYKSMFKFVVSKQEDLLDIEDEFGFLPNGMIMLMPAGDTRAKLNKIRPIVIDMCKASGFWYSERLHIVAWNKKTGV